MGTASWGGAGLGLADTGSDIAPWLFGAGVLIALGVIAFVVGQVLRSRRGGRPVAGDKPPSAPDEGDAGPISPDDPR